MHVRQYPKHAWPARFTAAALAAASLILWAAAFWGLWTRLPDAGVIGNAAATTAILAALIWRHVARGERDRRREDAYLDTIETLTRPAVARLTGPQQAIRRVK